MRKWVGISVIIVLLIGGVFVGLRLTGRSNTSEAQTLAKKDQGELPPVKADDTVMADAKVVPARSAALSFTTGGVVASLLVKDGQHVQSGQLLAKLSSTGQAATVAQADAQLLRAKAHLAELQAGPRPQEVAAAAAAVDKAKAHLSGVKVTGPPLEVTAAEAEVRASQAQLDLVKAGVRAETIAAAKAEVAAAQATLDQAKVTLANTELRAPFAGTVVGLKLNKGEFVNPGTPVVRVADTSTWQIETEDLTEISVVKVREGAKATLTFDALPDLNLNGKVADINPLGESKSGDITYTVTVDPERQDARLRWNMTATVTIKPGK